MATVSKYLKEKYVEVTLDTYNTADSVAVTLGDGTVVDIFSDGIVHVPSKTGGIVEFSLHKAAKRAAKR